LRRKCGAIDNTKEDETNKLEQMSADFLELKKLGAWGPVRAEMKMSKKGQLIGFNIIPPPTAEC
jgi:hypothetical protein